MVSPIVEPVETSAVWGSGWSGTFDGHSWTEERIRPELTAYKIARLQEGQFLRSHMGHTPELESFIYWLGAAHVLIIRDLRDVAVSQAYHVTSDSKLAHPDKGLYRSMSSFGDVLAAVIEGVDRYPGLLQRWSHYAPWLDVEWSEVLRFEEMRSRPYSAAKKLIIFGYSRLAQVAGTQFVGNEDAFRPYFKAMVAESKQTHKSPTFRKGQIGGWRKHFKKRHMDLFKEADKDGWLVRLGYEKKLDWRQA